MAIDFNGINSGQVNPQRNNRNESASTEKTPVAPSAQEQAQSATPAAQEKVSLSSRAKSLKQAEQKLKDHPEVDDAHVQAIKTALESGQFKIDARKLAQKMLEMDKSIFG